MAIRPKAMIAPVDLKRICLWIYMRWRWLINNDFDASLSFLALDQVAFDAENAGRHPPLVVHVLFAEEVQQRDFLALNSLVEKLPRDNRVGEEADRI